MLLSIVGLQPATSIADPITKRPKIGLVLAGGGALGMAHIGVLEVLEAQRIPVDIITGTSMGSIVGAAYASGATIAEMREILAKTDWDALFNETLSRSDVEYRAKYGRGSQILGSGKLGIGETGIAHFSGVVGGQNVLPLLQRLFYRTPGTVDFDTLPIPFRAVAADIETGEAVIIGKGDLAHATRASMAVPGFFTPEILDGHTLVDGGIANNLPVDVALSMGADRLIVVDLVADLKTKKDLDNLLGISGQIISLLLAQNSNLQRKNMRLGDVLLLPSLKGFSTTDFKRANEIDAAGEAAATAHASELQQFAVSEEEYRSYQARRSGIQKPAPTISAVTVAADIEADRSVIAERFEFQVGQPLDTAKLEEVISEVYKDRSLASLEYGIDQTNSGETVLTLDSKRPKWFEKYVQVGFSLQDDFKGNSAYQFALGSHVGQLNAAGGFLDTRLEIGWRPLLELDYYQPLAQNSPYFINPILTLDRYQIPVRINDETIAEYQRSRILGGVALGRQLGKSGELMAGIQRGSGDIKRAIGDPSIPEQNYEIGDLFSRITVDSRDTPDFPTKGVLFDLLTTRNTKSLGSSDDFTQMSGGFNAPITFGANTILLSTDFGTSFEQIPAERVFVLGGMFDISGYSTGEVTASDFVVGRVAVYRELASLGGAFAKLNLFGGGSFELASLRSDIAIVEDNTGIVAGSLFIGADTPIVPVYFAGGMNNDDSMSLYFNVGRIFKVRR